MYRIWHCDLVASKLEVFLKETHLLTVSVLSVHYFLRMLCSKYLMSHLNIFITFL